MRVPVSPINRRWWTLGIIVVPKANYVAWCRPFCHAPMDFASYAYSSGSLNEPTPVGPQFVRRARRSVCRGLATPRLDFCVILCNWRISWRNLLKARKATVLKQLNQQVKSMRNTLSMTTLQATVQARIVPTRNRAPRFVNTAENLLIRKALVHTATPKATLVRETLSELSPIGSLLSAPSKITAFVEVGNIKSDGLAVPELSIVCNFQTRLPLESLSPHSRFHLS